MAGESPSVQDPGAAQRAAALEAALAAYDASQAGMDPAEIHAMNVQAAAEGVGLILAHERALARIIGARGYDSDDDGGQGRALTDLKSLEAGALGGKEGARRVLAYFMRSDAET